VHILFATEKVGKKGCATVFFTINNLKEVITMRLRNILVLCAFTAMSVGMISCGKKADETPKADSTMTAPAAPAPAPAPAAAPAADSTKKMDAAAPKMEDKKMDEKKK
jgi:hypothetical protein